MNDVGTGQQPSGPDVEAGADGKAPVELYGGEVRLTFDPKRHRYGVADCKREGIIIPPSVTTVCGVLDKSGPLIGWAVNATNKIWEGAIQAGVAYEDIYLAQVAQVAKRAHRDIKQEAADIGSQVHHALEVEFHARLREEPHVPGLGAEAAGDERVRSCLYAAEAWLAEHEVLPLQIERRIYSRRHGYVGTLDKLAMVDGKLSLIDWKSSKGLYPEYRAQTAAYVAAYEEETGERVARRYLIRLGKEDGAFEAHEFNRREYKRDFKSFLSMLWLYNWLKDVK